VRRRLPLIALLAFVFLAISLALARYLSAENRERDAIYAVLVAQARGDARGMLARLDGCRGPCAATVRAAARRLKRPGVPKILIIQSPTAYALGSASGTTRVAWTIVNRQLPVVQCVRVRRTGNALFGRRVLLRSISPPLGGRASC
jgi:Zn-dependent protease with chaperone function